MIIVTVVVYRIQVISYTYIIYINHLMTIITVVVKGRVGPVEPKIVFLRIIGFEEIYC